MTVQYLVYGAGDPATALLRDHFFAKKIPIDFMDTRVTDADQEFANLKFLVRHQLVTIPQVFKPDGNYVGDYEAAKAIIDKAPTPDTSNIRAA